MNDLKGLKKLKMDAIGKSHDNINVKFYDR